MVMCLVLYSKTVSNFPLRVSEKIVDSGKRIIAFDINEVAPGGDEWDANVGARLLYRIANMVAKSNGRV